MALVAMGRLAEPFWGDLADFTRHLAAATRVPVPSAPADTVTATTAVAAALRGSGYFTYDDVHSTLALTNKVRLRPSGIVRTFVDECCCSDVVPFFCLPGQRGAGIFAHDGGRNRLAGRRHVVVLVLLVVVVRARRQLQQQHRDQCGFRRPDAAPPVETQDYM